MGEYKIYYIGKNNITWNKSNDIGYIFENLGYDPSENFLESINSLLDQVSTNPLIKYLLCCEDLTLSQCKKISEMVLAKTNKGKIFMNMTIYNKTKNAHISLPNANGFRKIVNIFPFDHAIQVCDQTVFEGITFINKTITVSFDPSKPSEKCFTVWYEKKSKQFGGSGNIDTIDKQILFNFRMMETNESTNLENTWWFKYYFSIPPCAYGRLSQSTGTCWLNACLNILFLSEPIANLLIGKYYKLPLELKTQIEQIERPKDILETSSSLQIILWSLVNIFLVRSKKATTLDSDFILVVGAKIKSICEHGNENYYIENNLGIDYGVGFITYKAFLFLLDFYLESNVDFFNLFTFYGLVFNQTRKKDELYDNYNYLKTKLNDSNFDEFYQIEKQINAYEDAESKTINILRQMEHTDKQIIIKWDEIIFPDTKISLSDPPKLFVFPTLPTTKIHQIIYVGETEYKLVAGGINFNVKESNTSHIVSGLMCGSKYYIYDSNDLISYTNWNQGIFNDYIEQLNDFYKVNGYSYDFQNVFVIYMRV